jgi:hypothetical protein
MLVLLNAAEAGLGALLFRIRAGEDGLRAALHIPEDALLLGVVALGRAAGDGPSGSARRLPARTPSEVLHRGSW